MSNTTCKYCKLSATKTTIRCNSCGSSMHSSCLDIPAADYVVILRHSSYLTFSCKECSKKQPKIRESTAEPTNYNALETALQVITKNFIQLAEDERRRNHKIVEEAVDYVLSEMKKENQLFNVLYREIKYTGSYYDNLKISNPREFDLNVVLKLPVNHDEMNVNYNCDRDPGCVKVECSKLETLIKTDKVYKPIEKWLEKSHLRTDRVCSWMESVISKHCGNKTLPLDNGHSINLSWKKSGPAQTLQIYVPDSKINIDVDLVPIIEFTGVEKLTCDIKKKISDTQYAKWCVVPKKSEISYLHWRLSFPDIERVLLKDKKNCKPVLRLVKKFRDSHNLGKLYSYLLKTVFLWKVRDTTNSYWQQGIAVIFLDIMGTIRDLLEKKEIRFYWREKGNMLEKCSSQELANMHGRFKKTVAKLKEHTDKDDVPAILGVLLNKTEHSEMLAKEDNRMQIG